MIAPYSDEGETFLGIVALLTGGVPFVFFAGALRGALTAGRAPEWLATVVFGGGMIYPISLAIFAMGKMMLIDAADLGQPKVAQALNLFDKHNFVQRCWAWRRCCGPAVGTPFGLGYCRGGWPGPLLCWEFSPWQAPQGSWLSWPSRCGSWQ